MNIVRCHFSLVLELELVLDKVVTKLKTRYPIQFVVTRYGNKTSLLKAAEKIDKAYREIVPDGLKNIVSASKAGFKSATKAGVAEAATGTIN